MKTISRNLLLGMSLLFAMSCTTHNPSACQASQPLTEGLKRATKVAVYKGVECSLGSRHEIEVLPTTWLAVDKAKIRDWTTWLCEANEVGAVVMDSLVKLLFVDERGEPLAVVHITTWNCGVEICPCKRIGNKYELDIEHYKNAMKCVRCEPLVRDIYAYMQIHSKDDLEQLRKHKAEYGEDLEDSLFRGKARKPDKNPKE